MNWNMMDYIATFILIAGTIAIIAMVWNRTKSRVVRIGSTLFLLLLLITIWVQLAVGVL